MIRDKLRSETALDESLGLRGSDGIWKMARLLGALRPCGRPIAGSRQGSGGKGGIRTHGGVSPTPVFKTGALNHSATFPAAPSIRGLLQRKMVYAGHAAACPEEASQRAIAKE